MTREEEIEREIGRNRVEIARLEERNLELQAEMIVLRDSGKAIAWLLIGKFKTDEWVVLPVVDRKWYTEFGKLSYQGQRIGEQVSVIITRGYEGQRLLCTEHPWYPYAASTRMVQLFVSREEAEEAQRRMIAQGTAKRR